MSILDNLISRLAPHTCLGCGHEGSIFCVQCFAALEKIPSRCYRCHAATAERRTCNSCSASSILAHVHASTPYRSSAKQLIWRLKFDGAQAAADTMAGYIAAPVAKETAGWLVPVPTASKRARSRGYDQAKLLAKQLSRRTQLPYVDCLLRAGQTHQVGSSRRLRKLQLQDAFTTKNSICLKGRKIFLVDDVVTTGATLEAAAAVLSRSGASEINAIIFAQA